MSQQVSTSDNIFVGTLQVGLKGQPPTLEGELPFDVKPDDCMWNLSDGQLLEVSLAKQDRMRWWPHVLKGEPEINIQQVWGLSLHVREQPSHILFCSSPCMRWWPHVLKDELEINILKVKRRMPCRQTCTGVHEFPRSSQRPVKE